MDTFLGKKLLQTIDGLIMKYAFHVWTSNEEHATTSGSSARTPPLRPVNGSLR